MISSHDRTWMRFAAAAALAAWLLSMVRVVAEVTVFQELYNPGYPRSVTPFAQYWGLAVVEAAALAVAVVGADRLLRPRSRVSIAGLAAGLVSAAMLAGGALAAIVLQADDRRGEQVAQFAAAPLGAWMLCVVAADWRLRQLPTWLRLLGAVLGAVLMVLPAVSQLRAALPLAAAWWIGLGVALLRAPRRSTSG